jgi:hypothetical protein
MSAAAFAVKLRINGWAGILAVAASFLALPVFVDFRQAAGPILWFAFCLFAAAALALSLHLLFDAALFQLLASHGGGEEGGRAVDDFLNRAALRKPPSASRPLAGRIAGTARLLKFQRAALLVFLALFVFMAAA